MRVLLYIAGKFRTLVKLYHIRQKEKAGMYVSRKCECVFGIYLCIQACPGYYMLTLLSKPHVQLECMLYNYALLYN